MIYGYLVLVIIMIIVLSTILWLTYKNNRLYINILLIITIVSNCFVYSGFAKYQGFLNRNTYYMMNRFDDSLLAFNKYKHNIDSIDEFDALVIEIRDLYSVTYYLETINNNFTLKNISVEEFGYIVTSLNKWIVNYLDIHKKLYKEDRSLAETYYESYNKIASLLFEISSHLVILSSNYYDNFRVLTFELKFNENSFEELSNIIQELNELLATFESN